MRTTVSLITLSLVTLSAVAQEPGWPTPKKVARQPLIAHVRQLIETLDYLGNPLPPQDVAALNHAATSPDDESAAQAVQKILDPHCLVGVQINPESRVSALAGPAKPELLEQGWRQYLVKVVNDAGVTAELKCTSPNARPLANSPADQLADRWMDVQLYGQRPAARRLSGLELEYRIIQLYSRDPGKRSATLSFNVGQGTQDLGFRSDVTLLFTATPATDLTLGVLDENNKPAMAGFVIRDRAGRVYPSQAKRLAPDLAFHPQVYRADGETLKLPPGEYTVEVSRGPEYLAESRTITVGTSPSKETFALKRWIDPSTMGWWSGDHHIHAAGCRHYTNPTEGVLAKDMIRHCEGEDLKVGCNLTWGPCFDFQKQFFTGAIDKVSQYPYLLRYDIEVSGFGSEKSGHLVLLRLKNEMYPGGDSDKHWPTLCLNTLRWAKAQGAVCGPAHSGWGLAVHGTQLPTYEIPPYDAIGANEYVVDVTHMVPGPDGKPVPADDFMSTVDTPYVWELNMWYHTLNCGFRTRASGETDFPCIYGEHVGVGRSYVKLDGKLDFDAWCEGIRLGRNYVSDGRSHLIDYKLNNTPVGEQNSEVKLNEPAAVHLTAKVAALLPEKPDDSIRKLDYTKKPYWHLERSRIGDSRQVKVEVVVNGYPVADQKIEADGQLRDLSFDVKIDRSSWVALRILPSSHTNPIWVTVADKPVRASRRSAQWCLKGVDQCWSQKQRLIKPDEQADAKSAYDHARQEYRRILSECVVD